MATIRGTAGRDTLAGFGGPDSIIGYAGDDRLTAGAGDTLFGGEGNDRLDASGASGSEQVTLIGGTGDDTYLVDRDWLGWHLPREEAKGGEDTLIVVGTSSNFADIVLPDGIENLIVQATLPVEVTLIGNDLANTIQAADRGTALSGGGGNDTLIGGAGNDAFDAWTGDDRLLGGRGDDAYYVKGADRVVEAAGEGFDRVEVTSNGVILEGEIEVITLGYSEAANSVTGTESDNHIGSYFNDDTLRGAGGNDWIESRDGEDLLDGGSGNDSLDGGMGRDTLRGGDGNDLLHGGEASGNAVFGERAFDQGGDGWADRLEGGKGDDTYFWDENGVDVIVERPGEGNDTIVANADFTLPDAFENLTTRGVQVTGTGNAGNNVLTALGDRGTLRGLDGNDTLIGSVGDDTLDGGNGADVLRGGDGSDTYVVNSTLDVATDTGSWGRDSVQSKVDWTLGAAFEDLALTGSAIRGTGNAGANTLTGSAGTNTLSGEGGNDRLVGGAGNDALGGGAGRDVVKGEDGDDRLNGGADRDEITGGAGRDTLRGDAGHDSLAGGDGNDWLEGGDGDDDLIGGVGNDSLTGGAGADAFLFDNGRDVVTDFTLGADFVSFNSALWGGGSISLEELFEQARITGGAAVFDFGGGAVLTIRGVSDLDALAGSLFYY